jgi:hypothetical protein
MITANQVLVTPSIAEKWLSTSGGNRNLSAANVAKYKADMLSGKWRYNGDRIRFLEDGTLYDGHHRLTACVESGVPILVDTFVIPDEAKPTIDTGKSRTTADVLNMNHNVGGSTASTIAAACRMMTIHDNTNSSDWARISGSTYAAEFLTSQAIHAYYLKNQDDIDWAAKWAHEMIKKQYTLISKSQAVVFISLAARTYNRDDAVSFLTSVITGYGVEAGSNADHIRNALLAVKMRNRKMAASHKLYSVIKCFKSTMAGRNIKYPNNAPFRPSAESVPSFRGSK